MRARQTKLPLLWLLSDERNDAVLESALEALPPGSGFVFRHYHLTPAARRQRFDDLLVWTRFKDLDRVFVLAGSPQDARAWGARGVYCKSASLDQTEGLLQLTTAHDGAELAAAGRAGADGVFLSPVFASRSHPDARTLGIHGFHVLAQQTELAVIALGGMTKARAVELGWPRWGAIDGLASPQSLA